MQTQQTSTIQPKISVINDEMIISLPRGLLRHFKKFSVIEETDEKESERDRQIREACEHILKIRKPQKGKVDYKALINMGRKY